MSTSRRSSWVTNWGQCFLKKSIAFAGKASGQLLAGFGWTSNSVPRNLRLEAGSVRDSVVRRGHRRRRNKASVTSLCVAAERGRAAGLLEGSRSNPTLRHRWLGTSCAIFCCRLSSPRLVPNWCTDAMSTPVLIDWQRRALGPRPYGSIRASHAAASDATLTSELGRYRLACLCALLAGLLGPLSAMARNTFVRSETM